MKCDKVQSWLLAERATTQPPTDVQKHLAACAACGRMRQRLEHLDAGVRDLPVAEQSAASRQRFLDELERTPQASTTMIAQAKPRFHWQRIGALAAALVLGIGLGWWLRGDSRTPAPASTDDNLVLRVLRHDIRLAETPGQADEVLVLADLADDLNQESLRRVERGDLEELPLLTELYEQVVRQGIVRQAARLPAEERGAVVAKLHKRLQDNQSSIEAALPNVMPATGEYLQAMTEISSTAAKLLDQPLGNTPAPLNRAGKHPVLLASLVLNGLRLADTDDPLQRADYCTDVADDVVRTILLAGNNDDQQAEFGSELGRLVEIGVVANLDRVNLQGANAQRRAEFERVQKRAARATAALERNLERAPAAARPGLQRALEASKHGRARAAEAHAAKGKDKRKGPPDEKGPPSEKGRPRSEKGKGKDFIPPGKRKKQNGV